MRYNTNGYNNGRNGFDSLSRFLTIVGLIILVASIVFRIFHLGIFGLVLSIIAIILFIYSYFEFSYNSELLLHIVSSILL